MQDEMISKWDTIFNESINHSNDEAKKNDIDIVNEKQQVMLPNTIEILND
jgi:hypothetical protein